MKSKKRRKLLKCAKCKRMTKNCCEDSFNPHRQSNGHKSICCDCYELSFMKDYKYEV